ncbi:MAG: pyridoxal phosphate enzyme (YggS family) [Maribacter sp.]|jgi:pyridoxal phosphate enzyme (YggS family)
MLEKILSELSQTNACLVAVSKTKPAAAIQEMYLKGQRIFGENRVQELAQKYEELPKDIVWHMIGHLQRNKVKYIAPFVSMIHGVESVSLLKEINKQAAKNDRIIDCLLQFKIAEEDSKFGLQIDDIQSFLTSEEYTALKNVNIVGVMGMATFTDDKAQVKNEFKSLKAIFDNLKNNIFQEKIYFQEISMGMSGDYKIAIEEGSTMVRIGSLLFGKR